MHELVAEGNLVEGVGLAEAGVDLAVEDELIEGGAVLVGAVYWFVYLRAPAER